MFTTCIVYILFKKGTFNAIVYWLEKKSRRQNAISLAVTICGIVKADINQLATMQQYHFGRLEIGYSTNLVYTAQ